MTEENQIDERRHQMLVTREVVVLEKREVHHSGGWPGECFTCAHRFELGEIKTKWRLGLPTSTRTLRGQFWTTQCRPCIERTKSEWMYGLTQL